MAKFTNQKPWTVTEEDTKKKWGGGFTCGLCGHAFKVNDICRWVYAGRSGCTNFFVCENCDGADVIEQRIALQSEYFNAKRILGYD